MSIDKSDPMWVEELESDYVGELGHPTRPAVVALCSEVYRLRKMIGVQEVELTKAGLSIDWSKHEH